MVTDLPIREAKPIKIGNSYYFSVPYQYVQHGAIKEKRLYDITIGKKNVLLGRKLSKKAGCWVFLIDMEFIKEKRIKLDRDYNILLNESARKRTD